MDTKVKKFDWQNMIIVDGGLYALTTKAIDNPLSYEEDPCKLCELNHLCNEDSITPCHVLGAKNEEYMTEVGRLLIKTHRGELQPLIFDEYEPV